MEFGARQCKPKNPDCNACPLNKGCVALQKNKIGILPIKLKKTKVSKKYFNFLVFVSDDNNTLFEKRTEKGIWKNLYQFPLIETDNSLTIDNFKKHPLISLYFKSIDFDFSLYNNIDIIHKLSHQHLHTKFWIIKVDKLHTKGLKISKLKALPTPILISNFIDEFNFE